MRSSGNRILTVARAFSVGLFAMYLFDPDVGRRRRSLLADKMRKSRRRLSDLAEMATRDAANRSRGLRSTISSRLASEQNASPRIVEARVRAGLGRVVSNPGALQVRVRDDGTVVLAGPVLANEVEHLISAARSVRGVKRVDNLLEVHEEPESISALQGPGSRRRRSATG